MAGRAEDILIPFAPTFRKASWAILIVSTVLTAGLVVNLAVLDPPSFHTDLADFAPDSEAKVAHERISAHFDDETRPMFVHVTRDDGGNILEMETIHLMAEHLDSMQQKSVQLNDAVDAWTTAPGIMQLALDEEANATPLNTVATWEQMLDLTLEKDTTCTLSADDQLRSAATFAASALLNSDLSIESTCLYLETGNGTAAPHATSTLWVLQIDPSLPVDERKLIQDQLRDAFTTISSESELTYGVASIDLISHDIDEGTFDNLALLIVLALVLVIALLGISFRSVKNVVFPMVGLSFALIWTYGALNIFNARFTALEVAVAPLVLGLGIDYSIHLQRRYAFIREQVEDAAEAWMRTCAFLSTPLLLAVITTVAAFLANILSPLPPLATFGKALAFGVVCAFLTSTIVVGAFHVIIDKVSHTGDYQRTLKMPRFSAFLTKLHREQQAAILLVALLISGASILGAMNLETEFDISDFLGEEMEIMHVRRDLESSYESAGWKMVYILMEPVEGASTIPGDVVLLNELRGLHSDLESNRHIVGSDSNNPSPSYEGPYVVIRDAILRDSSFGEVHNLEVYSGDGEVYPSSNTVDLAALFVELSTNDSVADPLTGRTWAQRVERTVDLQGGAIGHIRNEIRVDVSTSSESSIVIGGIESMLGSEDDVGKTRQMLVSHGKIHVTGDLVLLQDVLDGLNASQLSTTAISLGVSFFVLLILTRRFVPALLVLLPVVFATLWVVGSMIILGISWNVLTVMVTALSLGIGIDYAIHIWRRFEINKAETDDSWQALEDAIATTGVALIISAATTALGFLVLILSPMPLVQDFGLITGITVIFSLILCLLVLPVLLMMAEKDLSSGSDS
jgi:predicted RND superfamily exporter protein